MEIKFELSVELVEKTNGRYDASVYTHVKNNEPNIDVVRDTSYQKAKEFIVKKIQNFMNSV